MNIWYVISLSLVGLGIVFFIACFIAAIVQISRKGKILKEHGNRIQEQLVPLQTNVNTLNNTIGILMSDIEVKRKELFSVLEGAIKIKDNVIALLQTTKSKTKRIIEQTNNDAVKQAKTEEWINTALSYLKR